MSKAEQMAYNQIFDVTRALIEDAFYNVQDDVLKHFEIYYAEPYEIDIDFDEITDKIVDSVIGEILKG